MSSFRNYQVEELMRGVQRPLPPLPQRPLRAIAELLAEAWRDLLMTHPILRTGEEKVVNALMDARLNGLLEQKEEWKMLVTGVSRGKETINYDGSKLETRPDLSVHLTGTGYFFRLPLIVECKIMDAGDKKGIDLYCQKGLLDRFINGKYAWYAQEAFMLAYVRDGATIATRLTPYLERNKKVVPDPYLTEQLPHAMKLTSHDLARSRHERQFPDNPGPVDIWHLWLS